jgi:hypothetical protein
MTTAAANMPPATAIDPTHRNARGRFAPGNPGGPGRPPKIAHLERELLASMATVLGPEIWMRVTQAMALKAMEGNVAAANWLSKTFMAGGLSKAAAAQAVGITAEAEMLVLGKSEHPEWARLRDERLAERTEAEHTRQAEPATAIAAQPASAPSPGVTVDAGPSERTSADRAPTAPADLYSMETVETDKTVKTVESATDTVAATERSAPSVTQTGSPEPRPPLTVPPSERVRGFRVTKGPRPPENDRKRSKTAASPPPCERPVRQGAGAAP